MTSVYATTRATIYGYSNSWSLEAFPGAPPNGADCAVNLEIQGDNRNGYHLVMMPDGFFGADTWHETQQEAMEAAEKLFGVTATEWSYRAPNQDSN